jgi:hypothetical protein
MHSLLKTVLIIGAIASLAGCTTPLSAERKPILEVKMADRSLSNVIVWANLDDPDAVHDLCYRYTYGVGASLNYDEAYKWCSKGAESGTSSSQVLLAELYSDGHGVAANKESAFHWYQVAADDGHKHAMFVISNLYRDGNGVAQDKALSLKYLKMAAETGYRKAVEELKRVDSGFNPAVVNSDSEAAVAGLLPKDVTMEVAEGKYEERFYRFEPDVLWKMELFLEKLKSDTKWAPMQATCISSEGPSQIVCLSFSRPSWKSDRLVGLIRVFAADKNSVLQEIPLSGDFHAEKIVKIELVVKNEKLFYRINDREEDSYKLEIKPELLRIVCSTSNCNFKLDH